MNDLSRPMSTTRSTLFSRKDYLSFSVLVAVMLGGSLMELVSLGAIPLFVSLVAAPQAHAQAHRVLASCLQGLALPQPDNLILWGGVLLALLFAVRTVYLIASFALQERILQNRHIALSSRLFKAYMNAPYAYHLTHNSSVCIENVINEAEQIILHTLDTSLNLIRNSIILITVVCLLLAYDPLVCLGVFLALGLTAGTFMLSSRKKLRQLGENMYRERLNAIKNATEGIGAFKEAQILDRKEVFQERLHLALERLCNQSKVYSLIIRSTWPLMELITCFVILGTMSAMAFSNSHTTDIAPTIALVAAALARLKGTITEIMFFASQLRSNAPIAQAIAADLQELEAYVQNVEPDPNLTFTRQVRLQDISFAFPKAEANTLNHLSLTIPIGTSLAIVGPTGSGKSTVAHIIAALLKPQQGTLQVDDTALRTPEQIRAWQNLIGFVPQDLCIIDDTIRANIAFGVPQDQIDQQQLQEAMDAAQLRDFVNTLPQGDRTVVGERGVRLSGGQRQRIAIARALYRKPPFILFDEATSALDVTTEKDVVQALENLRGNHTVVVIAHRLSTVRHCDQVIFLKDGTIAGQGTYGELEQALPDFADMVRA